MRPIDADSFERDLKEKLLPLLVDKYGKEEAVKGLHFSLQDCISNIQGQPTITQPDPKWIPCSERLPEPEKKEYLICTDGGYQCQCRWTNTNHFWTDLTVDWHWHIMDVPQYSKVVAWMPLPEPYRGEQE